MKEAYEIHLIKLVDELISNVLKHNYPGLGYRKLLSFELSRLKIWIITNGVLYKVFYRDECFTVLKRTTRGYSFFGDDKELKVDEDEVELCDIGQVKQLLMSYLNTRYCSLKIIASKARKYEDGVYQRYYERYVIDRCDNNVYKQNIMKVIDGYLSIDIDFYKEYEHYEVKYSSVDEAVLQYYCLAAQDLDQKYINENPASHKEFAHLLLYFNSFDSAPVISVGYSNHVLTLKVVVGDKLIFRVRLDSNLVRKVELYSKKDNNYQVTGKDFFTGLELYNYTTESVCL